MAAGQEIEGTEDDGRDLGSESDRAGDGATRRAAMAAAPATATGSPATSAPGGHPSFAKDLVIAVQLLVLFPLAWVIPERRWPILCRVLASVFRPINDRHERLVAARMASAIDGLDLEPARRLALQQTAWVIEARLQIYREYRPGVWQARIAVEGMDRITALRSQSRPMILWVANQIFASLVVKKGLFQAGVPVHHVSAPGHGLAPARYGARFFKRIVNRVEDRYIAERTPYRQSRPAKAVTAMHRILHDRCVLSITAGVGDRSQVPVPILDVATVFPLSLGPVKLAWRTGAALLPCDIERASDGSFTVYMAPPLELASSDDVTAVAAVALRAFGRRISPAIAAQPAIWRFWPATSDQ